MSEWCGSECQCSCRGLVSVCVVFGTVQLVLSAALCIFYLVFHYGSFMRVSVMLEQGRGDVER